MRELSLYYLFVGCENVRIVLEVTRSETYRNETTNKSTETKYFRYFLCLFHNTRPEYTNPKDYTSSVSRQLIFYHDRVHVLQFEAFGCEAVILLRRSGSTTSLRLRHGQTNIKYAAVSVLVDESCYLYSLVGH